MKRRPSEHAPHSADRPSRPPHRREIPRRESAPRVPKRSLAELLQQRPLCPLPEDSVPTVEVRAPTLHPFLYRKRLGQFPASAMPGDWVKLKVGRDIFGWGLFNPHAEIAVRLLQPGPKQPDDEWWAARCRSAVSLRRDILKLDNVTDAYRVIHAEADGLSGLIVDKFANCLVIEAYTIGMYQRAEALADVLAPLCDTQHVILRCAPASDLHEGFTADTTGSDNAPVKVTVQEFGTKFKIDFTGGHKTGFYCDQRENRQRFASLCAGRSVLDACCYTGGFSIQAKRLGDAGEVTGVELDDVAMQMARENARLNHVKAQFVQADAFAYLRDMQRNGKQYEAIVLDPPKLIRTREETSEAKRKYFDLNRLALQLATPGAILMTCSCSGMLSGDEFMRLVFAAAHDVGRTVQLLVKSGAAPDHPIGHQCPETEYLKTLLLRVE